jgi:hypothetical protein
MPCSRSTRRGAIDRVFLAEAAEIELHAGLRQADRFRIALDPVPADQGEERRELASEGRAAYRSARRACRIPEVGSKAPSLWRQQRSAKSRSRAVLRRRSRRALARRRD